MWPMSVGISVVLLGGIAVILRFVSLPSSLLPPEHITDLWYYLSEFGQFFSIAECFAGRVEKIDSLSRMQAMSNICNYISAFLGAGIGYGIGRLEEFFSEEISVRKMQQGEWRFV